MVIQTEVTVQADHVLSACDGGEILHCRNCYLINLPAYPSSTIVNTSCVNFLSTRWRRSSSLLIINTSVSEEISVFAAWSTGND